MKTTYDERKFTELLVFVAARLQSDRSGGATKLDYVLFLADFAHVRSDHGRHVPETRAISHEEAGWRLVDFGDDIPCEAALVGVRQVSTPTSRRLEREVAERLGLIAT